MAKSLISTVFLVKMLFHPPPRLSYFLFSLTSWFSRI